MKSKKREREPIPRVQSAVRAEPANRRAGPEEKRVRRTITIRLTARTPLRRVRFMESVNNLLKSGTDDAEVSFNPPPFDEVPRQWFVADEESFLCGDCNEVSKKYDVADPNVEVWEFYSHGWLAPCVCGGCGLSLPVFIDAPRNP